MLKNYKKPESFDPWAEHDANYSKFAHSKEENFDFDEHIFVSRPLHGYCLTADITKNKGEKVTTEDLNAAFAISLCAAMTDFDFTEKSQQNYFLVLPPEFYIKGTYDIVCEKMANIEESSPKFEKPRLERNLLAFQEFAHKVNPEEIPAPPSANKGGFSKV